MLLDLPVGTLSFDDLLSDAIEKSLNKFGSERDSYLTANAKKHWNYILKEQQENFIGRNIEPIFKVVSSSSRTIECNLLHNLNTTRNNKYNLIKSRPYILNEIDLINARQYEALAIHVSRLLNANNVLLTPTGNEAGIDFIATIKFSDEANYLFGINGPIRIIGQCKKYGSAVQVDKIKEFNSTLGDVHHMTNKMRTVIPSWFSQAKGVIVGWIISHSGFQQGAKDRAKDYGIILSDSLDLSEIISTSKEYYPTTNYNQRHNNLKQELIEIIDEFK
jgi:hypothetical protein